MLKQHCACGGLKLQTQKGHTKPMPCFWIVDNKGATPVGTNDPLGRLHTGCFLAIGLFGLFPNETQMIFEDGFRVFLEKKVERYPESVEAAVYNVIPSPVKTQPNKGIDFHPTKYCPLLDDMPQSFSQRILQIILTECQKICSTTTLDDLDGGRAFTGGSLRGLWNSVYKEDQHPFIDHMRGVSLETRTACREAVNKQTNNGRTGSTKNYVLEAYNKKSYAREKAKRRQAKQAVAAIVARGFQVSDEVVFNRDQLIMDDPNGRTEQEKALFQMELGIDENWTPRPTRYSDGVEATITMQVRGGTFLSETILKFGKYYALSGTLTNPLGPAWKKVNGHQGILVAAKTLQERACMFRGVQLKTFDTCVWFSLCLQGVINHIRTKHAGGYRKEIPDGTIIYMAVIHPDSIYYQNLKTFAGGRNSTCLRAHQMTAIHSAGPIVIPNQWVKFEYRKASQLFFEKLPYRQPNVTGEDFGRVVFSGNAQLGRGDSDDEEDKDIEEDYQEDLEELEDMEDKNIEEDYQVDQEDKNIEDYQEDQEDMDKKPAARTLDATHLPKKRKVSPTSSTNFDDHDVIIVDDHEEVEDGTDKEESAAGPATIPTHETAKASVASKGVIRPVPRLPDTSVATSKEAVSRKKKNTTTKRKVFSGGNGTKQTTLTGFFAKKK